MRSIAGFLAFLIGAPAGARGALAPVAIDSVVVSRVRLTLSFAVDSSAGAARNIDGSSVMLAVDNDDISSPRLMVSFGRRSASTPATTMNAAACRAVTAKYTCEDSTRAEVTDGRLVITIQHAALIEWLFRERPTAVWVRASFANARAGYIAVRYIEPLLPSASRQALMWQDSVAASEGWGPWTREMWTSSFGALDTVWMRVGETVSAYLGEMQCRPIDSCNYRTDFAASGWWASDSSVVKLTVTDNPRRVRATITALRPGRSTVTVEGLHGPSDDLPRSTRTRAFTRQIVVTNRLTRLEITPRPTTIRVGSPVRLKVKLLDESGAIQPDAPINFLVIYDWPDNNPWSDKRYDLATRANLTTPGHRRFIAYFAGLADTLDVDVVSGEPPAASHQAVTATRERREPADARTVQIAKSPSLDVTVGASAGAGGHYFGRNGFAGELALVPGHEHAGLIAVTAGVRGSLASSDICAFEAGPGSRCLARLPTIAHVGVLGGWEYRHAGVALRAAGGPAFYGGSGVSGLGAQGNVDAAVGGTHLALVAAARGGFLAPFTAESLRLGSLELGVRFR